jgi:chemotaxis signal transduction protein
LTFRLAGQEFAIDATRVKGIVPLHDMETMEPFAGGPRWLMGRAAVHGRPVQVLDLARWLGLVRGAQGRNPYILAVDVPGGFLGFPVDRVCDVVLARARDYSHGKLRIGRPRRVLNADRLFSAESMEGGLPAGCPQGQGLSPAPGLRD